MTVETLEERVAALEADVASVKSLIGASSNVPPKKRGWRRLVGVDANNPHFEAAVQAGRAWRDAEPETQAGEDTV